MLRAQEDDYVTRIGPGTPMGTLMRQYWVPAMLSSELPKPDSPPVRVLLLGEKLIGFRDSGGRVGLLANHCPHRGASLKPDVYRQRSGGVILDADADWIDATQALRQAYVPHPELDLSVVGGFV